MPVGCVLIGYGIRSPISGDVAELPTLSMPVLVLEIWRRARGKSGEAYNHSSSKIVYTY